MNAIGDYEFSDIAIEILSRSVDQPAEDNIERASDVLYLLAKALESAAVSPEYEHEPHPLAKEFRDVSEALKELQAHVSNLED
tara:strand:- start:1325 stop:1573 length:249 start_codon:yes stop_codon:yes gene_type:complete